MSCKPHLSVVVIGHVEAGKTTTANRLTYFCSLINSIVQPCEIELRSAKQQSKYAYILEKFGHYREFQATVHAKSWKLESIKYSFTIIDTPGLRNYAKNIIAGISQADAALLVVSAGAGEFEVSISVHGQAYEQVIVAYAMGVKQVIVAINKMDLMHAMYSETRYAECKNQLANLLNKVGYKANMITFVPVCSKTGVNLGSNTEVLSWYNGPTLLQALDELRVPPRLSTQPLRIPIFGVQEVKGVSTVALGRVETGVLKVNDKIVIAPGNTVAEVKSIEMHNQSIQVACAGDNIGFRIHGASVQELRRGFVVGHVNNDPPVEIVDFVAHIVMLRFTGEIQEGFISVVHAHTCYVQCKFVELLAKYNRSGNEIESAPNVTGIKSGDRALVRLVPLKPMVVESFSDFAQLGRLILRDNNNTIAVGVVKYVNKK